MIDQYPGVFSSFVRADKFRVANMIDWLDFRIAASLVSPSPFLLMFVLLVHA